MYLANIRASVWYGGCHPIVHGKSAGRPHLVAPLATNSCGTFLALRYFWIAVLDGVPSAPNTSSTSYTSTSLRTCATALGGVDPSSQLGKVILRRLMPPRAFIIRK